MIELQRATEDFENSMLAITFRRCAAAISAYSPIYR